MTIASKNKCAGTGVTASTVTSGQCAAGECCYQVSASKSPLIAISTTELLCIPNKTKVGDTITLALSAGLTIGSVTTGDVYAMADCGSSVASKLLIGALTSTVTLTYSML